MKIRPVGAEMFHVEGWTDMTKLTVPFCDFGNAPGTDWLPALLTMRTAHFTHQLVEQHNTFINVKQWRMTVYVEKQELHYHMKSLKISSAANIPHKKVSGQVAGKWNTCITLHPVTNTGNAKTKQLTYRRYITLCFDKHVYCFWKQNYTLNFKLKRKLWISSFHSAFRKITSNINQQMQLYNFHLKHLKQLRHVSIFSDHHQGVSSFLAKVITYSRFSSFL